MKRAGHPARLDHYSLFPIPAGRLARQPLATLLRSVPARIDRFHFQKPLHQVLDCLEHANRSVSDLQIPLLPIRQRPGEAPDCDHFVGHRASPFHAFVRARSTSPSQKELNASLQSGRARPHRGGLPFDLTLSTCRPIVNNLSIMCNKSFAFRSVPSAGISARASTVALR